MAFPNVEMSLSQAHGIKLTNSHELSLVRDV